LVIIAYPLYPFIRHRRTQDEPFRVNLQDEPLSCQNHWHWLRGFPGRKGELRREGAKPPLINLSPSHSK